MASGRAILLLLLITVSVSVAQRRKNKKANQEPIYNSLIPPIPLPIFPFGAQPAPQPSRQFRPINIHYAPVSGGGHAHHAHPAEEHHHHYYDDHGHPVDHHHHHGDEHHHHHHQGHKGVVLEAKWTIPKVLG